LTSALSRNCRSLNDERGSLRGERIRHLDQNLIRELMGARHVHSSCGEAELDTD
jgi:hypothetical protein